MINENASLDVINGSENDVHNYVRFYFRPKTPTQFHNEGIRSQAELHPNYKAHCPVPIFFLFDIDSILTQKETYFTYESLASQYPVTKYNFLDSKQNLIDAPFNYIYHLKYIRDDEDSTQIIKSRQAEIIIKNECDLSALKHIICRNEPEKQTLINLLNDTSFSKYRNKIIIPRNASAFFYNSYTTISSVYFENNQLFIKWKSQQDSSFTNFKFEILSSQSGEVIVSGTDTDYNPHKITAGEWYWKTQEYIKGYTTCIVKIHLDNHLIYQKLHHI